MPRHITTKTKPPSATGRGLRLVLYRTTTGRRKISTRAALVVQVAPQSRCSLLQPCLRLYLHPPLRC
ncbi:unnamed protein product [Amoebophrya sp. A120]|nr:unnamed protein product [Amoebophrya sp. A120]|eukprot:GSA120T00013583001.1